MAQESEAERKVDEVVETTGKLIGGFGSMPVVAGRYVVGRLDGESHREAELAGDRIFHKSADYGGSVAKKHGGKILSGIGVIFGSNK